MTMINSSLLFTNTPYASGVKIWQYMCMCDDGGVTCL